MRDDDVTKERNLVEEGSRKITEEKDLVEVDRTNNGQYATGENDQDNQETDVCSDVARRTKKVGWTVVEKRVRTTKNSCLSGTGETKMKRKDERKSHSIV